MPPQCKVCGHKKLDDINQALVTKWRTKDGFRNIAKQYGVHYSSLYRHFCRDVPEQLWNDEEARKRLTAENLLHKLDGEYRHISEALTESREVSARIKLCIDTLDVDRDNLSMWINLKRVTVQETEQLRRYQELFAKLTGELKDVIVIEDEARVRRLLVGWLKLIPAKKVAEARQIAEDVGYGQL